MSTGKGINESGFDELTFSHVEQCANLVKVFDERNMDLGAKLLNVGVLSSIKNVIERTRRESLFSLQNLKLDQISELHGY